MKKTKDFVPILFILFMLCIIYMLFFYEYDNDDKYNNKYNDKEKYVENKQEIDEIEKRYAFYKQNINKYRLGTPKEMYKDLNNRIHQAPEPNDVYTSTLPKGCNSLYLTKNIDDDVCDMMNEKNVIPTNRNRY